MFRKLWNRLTGKTEAKLRKKVVWLQKELAISLRARRKLETQPKQKVVRVTPNEGCRV